MIENQALPHIIDTNDESDVDSNWDPQRLSFVEPESEPDHCPSLNRDSETDVDCDCVPQSNNDPNSNIVRLNRNIDLNPQ